MITLSLVTLSSLNTAHHGFPSISSNSPSQDPLLDPPHLPNLRLGCSGLHHWNPSLPTTLSAMALSMFMVLNTMDILTASHLVPLFWISPFNSTIIYCLPDIFIWLSGSICCYHNRTSAIESPISNLFSPSSIISVYDTSIHLISYTCQHSLDPNYKPSLWVNNGH